MVGFAAGTGVDVVVRYGPAGDGEFEDWIVSCLDGPLCGVPRGRWSRGLPFVLDSHQEQLSNEDPQHRDECGEWWQLAGGRRM